MARKFLRNGCVCVKTMNFTGLQITFHGHEMARYNTVKHGTKSEGVALAFKS